MGVTIHNKKNKAAAKLYSQIASYIFEQECGELKSYPGVKEALRNANKELSKLLK